MVLHVEEGWEIQIMQDLAQSSDMNRANSSLNHGDHEPYFKTRSQTDNTFCLFAEFIDGLNIKV